MGEGEVRTFNSAKKESDEITFPLIQGHIQALQQARTGKLTNKEVSDMTKEERMINRVKALHVIISLQKDIIQIARPYTKTKAIAEWEKRNRNSRNKKPIPFDEDINDHNKLLDLRKFLGHLDQMIIEANNDNKVENDLLIKIQRNGRDELELTKNFSNIFEELEDTYEEIYMILITHKIASAGINEDEELEDKQKEEECMRRIVDA